MKLNKVTTTQMAKLINCGFPNQKELITTPLALKWLRDVKNIEIGVFANLVNDNPKRIDKKSYDIGVVHLGIKTIIKAQTKYYETFEKAESAGINYALKYLSDGKF